MRQLSSTFPASPGLHREVCMCSLELARDCLKQDSPQPPPGCICRLPRAAQGTVPVRGRSQPAPGWVGNSSHAESPHAPLHHHDYGAGAGSSLLPGRGTLSLPGLWWQSNLLPPAVWLTGNKNAPSRQSTHAVLHSNYS